MDTNCWILINLVASNGANYWIRATALKRIFDSYEIALQRADDVIYSKEYIDQVSEGIRVDITKGKDQNYLFYKVDRKEVDAVTPYDQEIWDSLKSDNSYINYD